MWKIIAASLLALSLTGCKDEEATKPGHLIIKADHLGGSVLDMHKSIMSLNERGIQVEIHAWKCYSACTLYLTADHVCVNRSTTFGFHGPSAGKNKPPLTPEVHRIWVNFMAKQYRKVHEGLANFFLTRAAHLKGQQLVKVKGLEVIRLWDVKECS